MTRARGLFGCPQGPAEESDFPWHPSPPRQAPIRDTLLCFSSKLTLEIGDQGSVRTE